MAFNKGKRKNKSKYSELEKLAFNMGKIEKGLKSDTKVRDSYNNGLVGKPKKPRKPMC